MPEGLHTQHHEHKKIQDEIVKEKSSTVISKEGTVKYDDIQSHLEANMSDEQKVMAVDCCLNHDQRLKADPLNTLNLCHNFASTNAHGSRSENDRMECLCCSFYNTLTN